MCSYVFIKALSVVKYVMFILYDQWDILVSVKGGCRILGHWIPLSQLVCIAPLGLRVDLGTHFVDIHTVAVAGS